MEQITIKMRDGRIKTILGHIVKSTGGNLFVNVVKETILSSNGKNYDVVSFARKKEKIKRKTISSFFSGINFSVAVNAWDDGEY